MIAMPGLEELFGRELLARVDDGRWRRGEIKRERKLDTATTLWLMLTVALETGRRGLHEILRLGTSPPGAPARVSKAAFSKARERFSPLEPALPPLPPDPVPVPPCRAGPGWPGGATVPVHFARHRFSRWRPWPHLRRDVRNMQPRLHGRPRLRGVYLQYPLQCLFPQVRGSGDARL